MYSKWSRPMSPSTSSGAAATSKGSSTSRTFRSSILLESGSGRTATQVMTTLYGPSLQLIPGLFLSGPCLTLPEDPARKKVKLGRTSSPTGKFPTRKRRHARLRRRKLHVSSALGFPSVVGYWGEKRQRSFSGCWLTTSDFAST